MEKEKDKEEVSIDTKKKNLSFFLLIFPSLILSIIPSTFGDNFLYPLVIKVLIFLYQYFLLKNFVESIYD